MEAYLVKLAAELKENIKEVVDLSFCTEEEEELYFQFMVSMTADLALDHFLELLGFKRLN